jgi:hypothetical protein
LAVSVVLLGGTVLLVDEVISRRERRRWRALAQHAVTSMQEVAVVVRITTGNIWHEDQRTLAASAEAVRRSETATDPQTRYQEELDQLLLEPPAAAIERPEWRNTVGRVLGSVEQAASSTLAQWSVVTVGERDVSPSADALAAVVTRLGQIEWCLRNIRIAESSGSTDRFPKYQVAVDALPRLMLMLYRESWEAMNATEAFLANLQVPRLMEDRIEKDLSLE